MKKSIFVTAIIIIATFLFMNTNHTVYSDDNQGVENNEINIDAINYYTVFNGWIENNIIDGLNKFVVTPQDFQGGSLYDQSQSLGYKSDSVYLRAGDNIKFDVYITDPGLYQIYYDFYVLPESRLTPNLKLKINGETQYNEMNNIEIDVDWTLENELQYDRYGDQLAPKSILDTKWKYNLGLLDPNRFYTEPLYFKLETGTNEISLEINDGYVLVGDIRVECRTENILSYEEYQAKHTAEKQSLEELITIEAENMQSKSRRSITSKYKRDPGVTPYKYKNRVFNMLDGNSFASAGDKVTYTLDVEKTGYYNLAVKYYLNLNAGIPSHRRILIDGKVPFQELESVRFNYQTKWKNEVLKDQFGNPFEIYLEAGQHTLAFDTDDVGVRDIYHQSLQILQKIDEIALQINNLTGGLTDSGTRRDWDLTTYIPTLTNDLIDISNRIDITKKELIDYTGKKNLAIITELKIAKELIDELVEDPDDIPEYLSKFNEGQFSAYGRINSILPSLISNPLNIDTLFFTNDVKLPPANANIFVKIIESIKAFFYSFFDPKYNDASEVDEDTIEIWVNKSRLYVEIMQQKIDDEFTKETGIKVELSIMPDENKIILANAAGTTPDGAVGISTARPFELALRGVVEDLRNYDGFYELAEEFNPNSYTPYVYDEGVYAIPETQGVNLLFYRTDIFEQLGITPPDTLKDVISIIPVLQKYDMNYFQPIGNDSSYKGFGATTPFIYQFGGDLYDFEKMTTVINRDGAFDAFELMTDLYTVYNLPTHTANFFQHFRNGKIPVGVADQNMYIQLKYAAPEIAGQWDILPIPGVEDENGIIKRWDPAFGGSSILFSDSEKKDLGWELIKWWSSADVQADFSYEVQGVLGDRYLYMTANLEGFKESAWPSDSKDEILEQWKWIRSTGKVPGDYILEREISNAFNKVVFENISARVAIDDSILIINRELQRKLKEFGYMDENGNIIKQYKIPTYENIESWVRKNEE
ncbi:MAG: transporter substrate-binding protein [Haloplasmataceae bacterium]|jgi:ABC-type glycerol-3-phosphate transport system substrate-binding protein|nr:transporter substrate-binding protein [Haloplasmataceae bacterium]